MLGVTAARELLGGDLTPEAIDLFTRRSKEPMKELIRRRREIVGRSRSPLVPPLEPGQLRPLIRDHHVEFSPESCLDRMSASLLYAHQVAVAEPFERRQRPHSSAALERHEALKALHFLAAIAPLVDAGTVVPVPEDLLPTVKLNVGRVRQRLSGFRAALREAIADDDSVEWHLVEDIESHIGELELLASMGWNVHVAPLWGSSQSPRSAYVAQVLQMQALRRFWRFRMRRAFLGRFDSFAIRTLTEVPVPELGALTTRDLQVIRDEEAFGNWRIDLSKIIAEYERDLSASVPDSAAIASAKLTRRGGEIQRSISGSPALSALQAGIGTFAVSGSALLAAFPVLSVSGRTDGLAVAAGSSLIAAGRQLVFSRRARASRSLVRSQVQHYRAAGSIFDARACASA